MDVLPAVECIKSCSSARIYTHIDADGISAGAIISKALDRAGIKNSVHYLRQLEPGVIKTLEPGELTIFTDLGSGQLPDLKEHFSTRDVLVLDHHQPSPVSWPGLTHVNPHLQGFDGSDEISGAGVAYLVAKELSSKNIDLSQIAIVGAVGDMQSFWGRLKGLNRKILTDASNAGLVKYRIELQLYGRSTRPLFKSLQYFTDPYLPGVSNNESGAISFLKSLGISFRHGNKWVTLSDLSHEEKQRLGSSIVALALRSAPSELKKYVQDLIVGEVYELSSFEKGTVLHDADEFSTALNACGRNGRPEVGLSVCKGDMSSFVSMLELLQIHRRNLAKGLEFVESSGIIQKETFQYFDAQGKITETLVGTVAGMVLGSEKTDPYKPILAFAKGPDGFIKISARCSRLLVLKGINLGRVMREACSSVDGSGGGHFPAAGGYVPEQKRDVFLEVFGKNVSYRKQ